MGKFNNLFSEITQHKIIIHKNMGLLCSLRSTHTRAHTHAHARTHARIHTHTHTHTQNVNAIRTDVERQLILLYSPFTYTYIHINIIHAQKFKVLYLIFYIIFYWWGFCQRSNAVINMRKNFNFFCRYICITLVVCFLGAFASFVLISRRNSHIYDYSAATCLEDE